MNTSNHLQSIVTNARQGKPLSTRNRPRAGQVNLPIVLIGVALLAFWIVAGALATLAR